MAIGDTLKSTLSRAGGFAVGASMVTGTVFATIAAYTAAGTIVALLLVATPAAVASLVAGVYTTRGIEGAVNRFNDRQYRLGAVVVDNPALTTQNDRQSPLEITGAQAASATPTPDTTRTASPPQIVRSLQPHTTIMPNGATPGGIKAVAGNRTS